jgi:hypothetical protein
MQRRGGPHFALFTPAKCLYPYCKAGYFETSQISDGIADPPLILYLTNGE